MVRINWKSTTHGYVPTAAAGRDSGAAGRDLGKTVH